MKPNTLFRRQKQGHLLVVSFLVVCHFFNWQIVANVPLYHTPEYRYVCAPDTTVDSTQSTAYSTGDTINVYADGDDSIYILFEDTSYDSLASLEKTFAFPTRIIAISPGNHSQTIQPDQFGVTLTDLFEKGHANQDYDLPLYTTAGVPDPWAALVALNPKVVRFPSGSGSKYTQLLGSKATTDPGDDTKNGGYGYNINEIISFYDQTDANPNAPALYPSTDITTISFDMLDGDCTNCYIDGGGGWMDKDYVTSFEDFYQKWSEQPTYDPVYNPDGSEHYEVEPLYVNQLISLVKAIEDGNPGSTVDVVVCLNIINEPAAQCKAIIHYLEHNNIHNLHVVGVEMGNEVYFKYTEGILGIKNFEHVTAFSHYWNYINGNTYMDATGTGMLVMDPTVIPGGYADHTYFADLADGEFDLNAVLPASMTCAGCHDYIGAFKSDPEFATLKIGIPVGNLPNDGGVNHPFKEAGTDSLALSPEEFLVDYPQWNVCAADHYDQMEGALHSFDAVILHPYYTPTNTPSDIGNTNWKQIPMCLDLNWPSHLAATPAAYAGYQYHHLWNYDFNDADLQCAFNGIAGFPDVPGGPLKTGNFSDFTNYRIKWAFDEHASTLKFHNIDVGPDMKELWMTEGNVHDGLDNEGGDDPYYKKEQPYVSTVTNSFAHCIALQNWALENMKLNFQNTFRSNFFTLTTWQNFLGGTSIDMMNTADARDKISLGIPFTYPGVCPDDPNDINYHKYYLRRMTYFEMGLLTDIYHKQLEYVGSVITKYSLNYNDHPTLFIHINYTPPGPPYPVDPYEGSYLTVYFTNKLNIPQTYFIEPGGVANIIHKDVHDVGLGIDGSMTLIDPAQLYSTCGNSTLFYNSLDDAYTPECYTPLAGPPGYPHHIDVSAIQTLPTDDTWPLDLPPLNGVCVTVPPTSSGYFTIPLLIMKREGSMNDLFRIFPNPASNLLMISYIDPNDNDHGQIKMEIHSITGSLIKNLNSTGSCTINIEDLPVGTYMIIIKKDGYPAEAQEFLKMH